MVQILGVKAPGRTGVHTHDTHTHSLTLSHTHTHTHTPVLRVHGGEAPGRAGAHVPRLRLPTVTAHPGAAARALPAQTNRTF